MARHLSLAFWSTITSALVLLACSVHSKRTNTIEDENIYDIEWLEHDTTKEFVVDSAHFQGPLSMRSLNNESYSCFVPVGELQEDDISKKVKSTGKPGLAPWEVVQGLMDRKSCMVRVEGYWIYELCHGRHLRQFHQEIVKQQQLVVTKEYYLGRFNGEQTKQDHDPTELDKIVPEKLGRLDWGGEELPFYETEMVDGTPCDIMNDQPRQSRVRYACVEGSGDAMLRVSEIATCEYELLVSLTALCLVPGFRPEKAVPRKIQCYSESSSYVTPLNVKKMQEEIAMARKGLSFAPRVSLQRQNAVYESEEEEEEDGEAEQEPEQALDSADEVAHDLPQTPWVDAQAPVVIRQGKYSASEKQQLDDLLDFLTGKFCVHGGSGYWKHSFCFGKTVIQYHEEGPVMRNEHVITLGVWDEKQHLAWIAQNPRKKPSMRTEIKSVINFYQDGDICDLTGVPRAAEVKLKCGTSGTDQSSSSVSLYLLEPKPCYYSLGVESAMFCRAMPYVDHNGIIDIERLASDIRSKENLE